MAKDIVRRRGDDSPFAQFLNNTVSYEKTGAVIPMELLRFGLFGSLIVIATGLVALMIPSAGEIQGSDFFLVLEDQVADISTIMHTAAFPAIGFGVALLLVDLYLMRVPTSEHSRVLVVGQAAAGGIGGMVCAIFLALALLNLVLWIIIIVCCIGLVCMILAGAGG